MSLLAIRANSCFVEKMPANGEIKENLACGDSTQTNTVINDASKKYFFKIFCRERAQPLVDDFMSRQPEYLQQIKEGA